MLSRIILILRPFIQFVIMRCSPQRICRISLQLILRFGCMAIMLMAVPKLSLAQSNTSLLSSMVMEQPTISLNGTTKIVMGYQIQDMPNGSATKIQSVTFFQGAGNGVSDWTQIIQSATLRDVTCAFTHNIFVITPTTVSFNSIPINGSGMCTSFGTIQDGSTKMFQLELILKTALLPAWQLTIDGLGLTFLLNTSSFTYGGGGFDQLAPGQNIQTNPTYNKIDVVPTKLIFTQQPTATIIGMPMPTNVTVAVTDNFGNYDLGYVGTIQLNSPGLVGAPSLPVGAGIANFTGLTFSLAGSTTLTTSNGTGLTNAVSNSFTVTALLAPVALAASAINQYLLDICNRVQ